MIFVEGQNNEANIFLILTQKGHHLSYRVLTLTIAWPNNYCDGHA